MVKKIFISSLKSRVPQQLIGLLENSSKAVVASRTTYSHPQAMEMPRHDLERSMTKPVKENAILIPIVKMEDQTPWLIMTRRSYKLRAHRGELCFPGGRMEKDETIEQAALREAYEEINIDPNDLTISDPLPPLISKRKDSKITPVFGILPHDKLYKLKSNPDEVQCIYLIPLNEIYASKKYTNFLGSKVIYELPQKMPLFYNSVYKIISKTDDAYIDSTNHLKIWGVSAFLLDRSLEHVKSLVYV